MEELERLRQKKIVQDQNRADEKARCTEVRELISRKSEDAMRIDVEQDQQETDADNMRAQQQIAHLKTTLHNIEQGIAEMETAHKESYDEAIEGLVELVKSLKQKQKMLDAGCVGAAGASSALL